MAGLIRPIRGVLFLFIVGCSADDSSAVSTDGGETTAGPSTSMTTMSDETTASTTMGTSASTTVGTTDTTTATSATSTDTETTTDATATDTGTGDCAGLGCAPDEYCDWPVNSCGANPGDVPVCTPRPDGCPPSAGSPACGCDGVVYVNDCGAATVGVDVDEAGDCTPPSGTFGCGFLFCDPTESYCQSSTSDVGGYPNGYSCVPLPQTCGDAPSCECLADEPCAAFGCEMTPEGGLRVICPGG